MIELRSALSNLLKNYHDRVYYQQAPTKKVFPYVVYNLPNSFEDEDQEIFVLDVDIWDYTENTTALETLSSELWKALNRYRYINEKMQFSLYRSTRLTLEDDDPKFKRRKLIFELRYFDRRI